MDSKPSAESYPVKRPPKVVHKLGRDKDSAPPNIFVGKFDAASIPAAEDIELAPLKKSEDKLLAPETALPAEKPSPNAINVPLFVGSQTYGREIYYAPKFPLTNVGFMSISFARDPENKLPNVDLKDEDLLLSVIIDKPAATDIASYDEMANALEQKLAKYGWQYLKIFSHFNSSGTKPDQFHSATDLPQFGNTLIFETKDGRLYELSPKESPYHLELAAEIELGLAKIPEGAISLEDSQKTYDCIFIKNAEMKRMESENKLNIPKDGYATFEDHEKNGFWLVRTKRFTDEDKWQEDVPHVSRGLVQYFERRYGARLEYFDPPKIEDDHDVKLKIHFSGKTRREQAIAELASGDAAAKTRPIDLIAKSLDIDNPAGQIAIPIIK